MTDSISFTLPGVPTAKGRPRFYNGRAITDAKTRAAEQSILAAWLHVAADRQPHTGPVEVRLIFTFNPAESWPKWKRDLANASIYPHTKKPDLDNLIKVLDGLNGIAWIDDSQILHVSATKHYGPVANTQVQIFFLPEPTKPERNK